ncbi:MAG: cellulose synthase/poly-beta-1,6-N-acetylglucosamine synthase-like glycosyltransferase, partial [Kiritimatiellia bacterium]
MTLLLFGVGLVLTLFLFAYALGHYLFAVVFLIARTPQRSFDEHPTDSVTVLVPARNEGEGAVRAIGSLLAQDHRGPLTVALLVNDRADSSVPFLRAAYPDVDFSGDASVVALLGADSRRAIVCFTGSDPKHTKVNWAAERLDTPFVAILDCDHQALPDWVRTSLVVLAEQGVKLVQSRRQPLTTPGLFGLWDSLHQHIGCEVSNVAYSRMGLTVFFTGTTVVMGSEVLRNNPLADCLTEDTDLSYRLLLQGERLGYNPHSGSREEVSPDLYSFLARRRRWSHGHTEAFFARLGGILSAPIGLRTRVQLLFHGMHYFVALAVFVAHTLIGVYLAQQLPLVALGAAAVAGLVLSVMVVRSQRFTGWLGWAGVVSVLFVWFTPAVLLVINLGLALALGRPALAALPVSNVVQALALVGFVSPLVVLMAGLAGYRQLGVGSGLAVVLSYPIAFYLDVSGVLIGMVDLVAQRRTWFAVARAPVSAPNLVHDLRDSWGIAAIVTSIRDSLLADGSKLMKPSRWMLWPLLAGVVALGVYLALPAREIPVAARSCEAQEHDGHPWVVPPERLTDYCTGADQKKGKGTRTGSFAMHRTDDFSTVSGAYWDRLDDTFPCNLARFQPENVVPLDGGGVQLTLKKGTAGDREYSSGSIATKNVPEAKFLYGRFEVEMKPAKASGVLTAFFLYRFDPWQEIDMEFLGK